jgi:general secretion pathway protein H
VDALKEQEDAQRMAELQRDNAFQAQIEAKTAFGVFQSSDIKRVTLPDGVSFAQVWVQHQAEPYQAGNAFLYFFPQGRSERALVTLKQKDDYITVKQNSLSGRVQVVDGMVEVPKS